MTNEEAIEILEEVKLNNDSLSQYFKGFDEAFEIAINSIKKQIPKKPIPYRHRYIHKGKEEEQLNFRCPVCSKNKDIDFWNSFVTPGNRRCSRCDTLLDWMEGEEA